MIAMKFVVWVLWHQICAQIPLILAACLRLKFAVCVCVCLCLFVFNISLDLFVFVLKNKNNQTISLCILGSVDLGSIRLDAQNK